MQTEVIMAGFGFTETIDKLGVERRVMTAGENKALMDPFAPVNADQQKHVQNMLDEIHRQFIDAVRQGRGERLVEGRDKEIFSGLFWTGEQAKALGLVDGLGSPGQGSRDRKNVRRTHGVSEILAGKQDVVYLRNVVRMPPPVTAGQVTQLADYRALPPQA